MIKINLWFLKMRSRRRRRPERLVLGFIILIVAFGLGSTMGISMGFNDNSTNIVQNNTTHVPIDVTHNISAYENNSNNDNNDNQVNASNNSEGVVQYTGTNSSSSDYSSNYQTTDVDSSQYY